MKGGVVPANTHTHARTQTKSTGTWIRHLSKTRKEGKNLEIRPAGELGFETTCTITQEAAR